MIDIERERERVLVLHCKQGFELEGAGALRLLERQLKAEVDAVERHVVGQFRNDEVLTGLREHEPMCVNRDRFEAALNRQVAGRAVIADIGAGGDDGVVGYLHDQRIDDDAQHTELADEVGTADHIDRHAILVKKEVGALDVAAGRAALYTGRQRAVSPHRCDQAAVDGKGRPGNGLQKTRL